MSEHSVLLKYLLPTDKRSKMTDIRSDDAKLFVLTIENDRGINSEVPSGPHDIRPELDEAAENVQEEVNFMPVMTVKKEEAAYAHSKNDLKLQKVSVTENISDLEEPVVTHKEEQKRQSKIPVKFKRSAEKVIKNNRVNMENEEQKPIKNGENQSNRLTPKPISQQVPKTNLMVHEKNYEKDKVLTPEDPEYQFDKIYELCKDDNIASLDNSILQQTKEIDPNEIDNIFKEIVQESEVIEKKTPIEKERKSKIPVFRTRSSDFLKNTNPNLENGRSSLRRGSEDRVHKYDLRKQSLTSSIPQRQNFIPNEKSSIKVPDVENKKTDKFANNFGEKKRPNRDEKTIQLKERTKSTEPEEITIRKNSDDSNVDEETQHEKLIEAVQNLCKDIEENNFSGNIACESFDEENNQNFIKIDESNKNMFETIEPFEKLRSENKDEVQVVELRKQSLTSIIPQIQHFTPIEKPVMRNSDEEPKNIELEKNTDASENKMLTVQDYIKKQHVVPEVLHVNTTQEIVEVVNNADEKIEDKIFLETVPNFNEENKNKHFPEIIASESFNGNDKQNVVIVDEPHSYVIENVELIENSIEEIILRPKEEQSIYTVINNNSKERNVQAHSGKTSQLDTDTSNIFNSDSEETNSHEIDMKRNNSDSYTKDNSEITTNDQETWASPHEEHLKNNAIALESEKIVESNDDFIENSAVNKTEEAAEYIENQKDNEDISETVKYEIEFLNNSQTENCSAIKSFDVIPENKTEVKEISNEFTIEDAVNENIENDYNEYSIPKGRVGALTNAFKSNEPNQNNLSKSNNVLPKKKNILQKIAMFEQPGEQENRTLKTFKSFHPDSPKEDLMTRKSKTAEIKISQFEFDRESNVKADNYVTKPTIVNQIYKIDRREEETTKVVHEFDVKLTEKISEPKDNIVNTGNPETNLNKMKSVSEKQLNDTMKGKVNRLVERIISMENLDHKPKEVISIKEMPKKKTVSDRIALFEKMSPAIQRDKSRNLSFIRTRKQIDLSSTMDEEEIKRCITELKQARAIYGHVEEIPAMDFYNGYAMPYITLGTALIPPGLVRHVVEAAIDLGYRSFDTAYIYENEHLVGEAIRTKIDSGVVKREDLFIVHKLWSTFHRSDLVEKACRDSLNKMGLDYFDLYLIHSPMSFKEGSTPFPKIANVLLYSEHDYLEAWLAMEQLLITRLVRNIGVSNFNSEQISRILDKGRVKPVVNQVECHPYLNQKRLSAFCESKGIRMSCFGTLGSKGTPADLKNPGTSVIDDPTIGQVAEKAQMTPAQVLIRYQMQRKHGVVAKTSSAARLWENLKALDCHLTDEEMDVIDGLNKNRRYYSYIGMGDTHKNYPFKIPF